MTNLVPTPGEEAMEINFDEPENTVLWDMKKLTAELINYSKQVDALYPTRTKSRLISLAITNFEQAMLWVEKGMKSRI